MKALEHQKLKKELQSQEMRQQIINMRKKMKESY